MRTALAILFVLHGIAHGVGFAVPWGLVEVEETAYSTTLLAGKLDVGDPGIRLVGVLWLVTGVAFVAAGAGVLMMKSWWLGVATTVALASLLLSILGWPEARIGVGLNVVIIAVLLGIHFGWWSV